MMAAKRVRDGGLLPAAPANLAAIPDGPLVRILSELRAAELRGLACVCRGWRLGVDGSRTQLWYGLAAMHGLRMPTHSRSLRSKASPRETFIAAWEAARRATRQLLDKRAMSCVRAMQTKDAVGFVGRALQPQPRGRDGTPGASALPVAHEIAWQMRDGNATLLHAAARYGRTRCAVLLLDTAEAQAEARAQAGAGVPTGGGRSAIPLPLTGIVDAGGATPLLMAAWCGHLQVVQLLLSRGARPEPRGVPPLRSSCGGRGPFDAATWAARKGFGDIAICIANHAIRDAGHGRGDLADGR